MTMMATEQNLAPPRQPNGHAAIQRFDPNAKGKDSKALKSILEQSKDRIAAVIPRHLNADKLLRVAMVAVNKSDLLGECTITSILQCIMTGAQLGLDVSGVLGSAYMVPFYNGKKGTYEAVFIPGYRGLIDLARRSGEIDDIYAHCVYVNDAFDVELGDSPKLTHKPNLSVERNDDDIVGSYMVAWLKGNVRPHIEFVPRADIEKVRKSSKAAFDRQGNPKGPWRDWFSEMARKTAIRRGIKYLPMSIDLADALTAEDEVYNRTDVLSASTSPDPASAARVAAAVKSITSKPVSENQTFDPDPAAVAQAAQESEAAQSFTMAPIVEPAGDSAPAQAQQAEGAADDINFRDLDGSSEPNPTEAEQIREDELREALGRPWDEAEKTLADAGVAGGLTKHGALAAARAHVKLVLGMAGQEKKIAIDQRLAMHRALKEGRMGNDGKVTI